MEATATRSIHRAVVARNGRPIRAVFVPAVPQLPPKPWSRVAGVREGRPDVAARRVPALSLLAALDLAEAPPPPLGLQADRGLPQQLGHPRLPRRLDPLRRAAAPEAIVPQLRRRPAGRVVEGRRPARWIDPGAAASHSAAVRAPSAAAAAAQDSLARVVAPVAAAVAADVEEEAGDENKKIPKSYSHV